MPALIHVSGEIFREKRSLVELLADTTKAKLKKISE